jgi:SAM-dependent methyltransferase
MDAAYLGGYRDLYLRHWWWRSREALLTREIALLAPPGGFGRILDVGCGDGLFFPALQRFGDPYGIEPAVEALTPDGPWRPRIHAGPLDASFQPGHRFGLVLALDVIEHLDDPDGFMEHVRRVVEPGGWFVATVPAFRALWTAHDDLNQHVTRFRRAELVSLVAAHGFEVVHSRYFFVLLAGAKLLVRGLERLRRARPGSPGVPAGPVNALLEFSCRAEQAVLGRHAPWFGSSLLLVARAPR